MNDCYNMSKFYLCVRSVFFCAERWSAGSTIIEVTVSLISALLSCNSVSRARLWLICRELILITANVGTSAIMILRSALAMEVSVSDRMNEIACGAMERISILGKRC